MPKPNLADVPAWYHRYINEVQEDDLHNAIRSNSETAISFFKALPEEKWTYRYAEGKWSIKEMLQHIIDAERIFSYRALCFARKDATPLPGFDEDSYATASNAERRTKEELVMEFTTLRNSIEQLFASFDEDQLASVGISNNSPISVNAIGFIIPGHVRHHINVIKERYLNGVS
ncbi:MAG TPA: DinB family protein [Flavisolibacter sp.]|nr:DinB family protein [Flavisolibacter sp.]